MTKSVDLDKLRSINVSAVAVPSRRKEAAGNALWHQHNERDVAAYRRLRADGVQPPQVHGAWELERNADTVEQVEGEPVELPAGLEFANAGT